MRGRIAIIIERADVALGGAERSVTELAAALSEVGWTVDILAAKGAEDRPHVHVLCRDVPGKRISLRIFAQALQPHLAETHYGIVHSVLPLDFCDVYQPRGGTYAETLARHIASYRSRCQRGFKRVTALTNVRRTRLLRAERKLCGPAQGPVIAALSRYVADQFKKHYGTDDRRLVLIRNGVATNRPSPAETAARLRSQILSQLTIPNGSDPLLMLFAAHNFRLKGLDSLIRALHSAGMTSCDRMPCLIVMGAGHASPYRRLAQRLGVEERVIFLGSSENVCDVLAVSDVGVLPTYYDPSSRFILEALAAGKPVITTAFNGATDHFVAGRHGLVIDTPDDVEALAQAIVHFADPGHAAKATEAIVADKLKETLSVGRVARELSALYESILRRKSS